MPDELSPWFALNRALGMPPMSGGAEDDDGADPDTPDAPDGGPTPDGGAPAEPAEGSPPQTDDTNWQERYENLQPEYTRVTQEAARYRQVFDLARQGDPEALEALGIQVPKTDDEPEYEDPETRLERLERQAAERADAEARSEQEAEFEAAVDEHLGDQLDELEKEHGKLDDQDVEYLLSIAEALFTDEQGVPDLAAAYKYDSERLESKREGWVQSKRQPQVASGASASHQPDLDDKEQRREYMHRKAMEAEELA